MNLNKIRSIVVDDVDMIRMTMKKLLQNFPVIELVGEAADYDSAKELINKTKPDLVFLDIDLNGITSLDLINEVNCNPKIIFITAHPDFALKAFELNAVDYIMKPISIDRIRKAIERITSSMVASAIEEQPEEPVAGFNESEEGKLEAEQLILLNFDNKMNFIKIKDIHYIEAFGNYTKIYMVDGKLSITYNSIKGWASRLPEDLFIQIHRSTMVNLTHITKIERAANDTGRLKQSGNEKPF
jgi:two-component system LytT family response regulator